MRRWAEKKYRLPWTHECFQSQSLFELLISFWEDYYDRNPIASRTTADGNVVFANTGDPLIDKWERELAQGLQPDLLEGLPPKRRELEQRALEKFTRHQQAVGAEGLKSGFVENYLERAGLPTLGGGRGA